jgi:ATP-dependent phosphofructokinase / diphosphate-dependent phosphofructokinase
MRIGVLTGGGDCPGLNAAIRAVVRRAAQYDFETVGIRNGWAGLMGEGDFMPLAPKAVAGIIQVGGTILGAGRTNPFRRDVEVDEAIQRLKAAKDDALQPAIDRLEEYQTGLVERNKQQVLSNLKAQGIDALVVIGGKDTLGVASRFARLGVPVTAVPKTMDNDLPETDYCIGFNSAITRVTEALDNLHTTATAHNRVMVVEVMGRETGWVALMAGLAGGADYIVVPEVPTSIDDICQHLIDRHARGKSFSIVVVSEGADCPGVVCDEAGACDAFGHPRLDTRGIGNAVAKEIERRTRFETRHVVLGHLHRGGAPTVFDRVLATRLGVAAVDLLKAGNYGQIAVLRDNAVASVDLDKVANKTRPAERYFYDLAAVFFGLRHLPAASPVRRIGVLTGGGDCPGLNAAIRAVARRAFEFGWEVMGLQNGWASLLDGGDSELLTPASISGILHQGGTMLGTSRTNPGKKEELMQEVSRNIQRLGLNALVAIGGDDTLGVAAKLHQRGIPVVGVPKTMDNDIAETDYCIGFDSAVTTVTDALDKLHTTAMSHHRAMVVEVMGRDAGWVAVYGGLAGGADYILAPEVPVRMADLCAHLQERVERGKHSSIIVVSEGATITDLREEEDLGTLDAFGHVRLDKRGLGEKVAKNIETCTGLETRNVVLGHLQRGGSPTVFDRVLATRTGVAAVDLIRDGRFGYVPVLKGDTIVPVELERAVARTKTVSPDLYELATVFF